MDKLVFKVSTPDTRECGPVVRIKPSAAVLITDLMRRTGLSATQVASRMIEYAYKNCEVEKK